MIFVSPILISIIFSAWIPLAVSGFFPEIFVNKKIDFVFLSVPTIYLFLITIASIFFFKRKEVIFLQTAKVDSRPINPFIAIISLIVLWVLRLIFFIIDSESIYLNIIDRQPTLISYLYIEFCFRLYPLFVAFFVFGLSPRVATLVLLFEVVYGVFIFSKLIIIISGLALVFVWHESFSKGNRYSRLFNFAMIGLIGFCLFAALHTLFGFWRTGFIDVGVQLNLLKTLGGAISRLQSISSIYYANDVVEQFLFGKSLCMFFGFLVPDSVFSLPYHCQNVDENLKFFYGGHVGDSRISLDLLGFWGEPFLNFGVLGVFFILFYCLVGTLLISRLGSNTFGLSLYWVFLVNTLISHQSLSLSLRNIVVSYIVLVVVGKINKKLEQRCCDSYG